MVEQWEEAASGQPYTLAMYQSDERDVDEPTTPQPEVADLPEPPEPSDVSAAESVSLPETADAPSAPDVEVPERPDVEVLHSDDAGVAEQPTSSSSADDVSIEEGGEEAVDAPSELPVQPTETPELPPMEEEGGEVTVDAAAAPVGPDTAEIPATREAGDPETAEIEGVAPLPVEVPPEMPEPPDLAGEYPMPDEVAEFGVPDSRPPEARPQEQPDREFDRELEEIGYAPIEQQPMGESGGMTYDQLAAMSARDIL